MPVRVLHVADVHLDAPFRWLGGKGGEQRQQLKETFRAVVDLALREQVAALLIAGDLYDSNAPAQDTLDLVRSQLGRLRVPVVVLPGTHDCLDGAALYRRVDLTVAGGPPVHIFDESHVAFDLGPALTVHGRANLTKTSAGSPLRDLHPSRAARFNIALAHGSLAIPGAADDFPITVDAIRGSGMDYLALGHWHSYRDCSAGATKACYSGPPEMLGPGELGAPLLIELDEGGVSIRPCPVGRRRYEKLAIPLDQVSSAEDILALARARRADDLVLAVTLAGLRALDLMIDPERLAQELAPGFFAVSVADASHPKLAPDEVAALPAETVIGQFARRMSALVGEAQTLDESRTREAALQLGLALLQGRKVL